MAVVNIKEGEYGGFSLGVDLFFFFFFLLLIRIHATRGKYLLIDFLLIWQIYGNFIANFLVGHSKMHWQFSSSFHQVLLGVSVASS